ncbi:MAG: NADH-quinone oxidoreductase subunit N [Clostridia bacterium]|jgi:NADH-quinone oxidoreductase subunit N|nr:NADH-quinone oxidoreductase subunit N [Clostridia bacterium]MDH7572843.1 NADH-quinone oxidoreductase subunit N [Clostridia bacterium]
MAADWALLSTEILLAALGLGLLALGLVVPRDRQRSLGYLASVGLALVLLVTLARHGRQGVFLGGSYLQDAYAAFFKELLLSAAILATIASHDFVPRLGRCQAEFYALVVFATLGMVLVAGAGDLVTLYLGLELMTISFCLLAAFNQGDPKSQEAGLKYILLGAMSSAVLLYGLSLVYGLTGTTRLGELGPALAGRTQVPLLIPAVVFLIAGFAFKIAAVPFHFWSPDVYEGAPTPVTALLAVGSKAAALAALIRLLVMALPEVRAYWGAPLVLLCLLTVLFANLVAIPQTNIKRLLAYSSISQAGYLLLGVVALSPLGLTGVLFHSLLYVFANMAAFMVVTAFWQATGSDEIPDYAGLARRAPLLAAVMLFSLLSLAGIPPLAGFWGKFYLFTAAIERGYVWLALVAVIMTMVSVYYYLLVAKAMFIKEPPAGSPSLRVPTGLQVAMVACLVVILLVGTYPGPLTRIAADVAQTFLR